MKSDTTEATTATVGNAWTTIPAATALEDQHFNPAKCEVRRAVPRDDVRCETSLRSKVFVSGLREDTREATLKHYFGKFGLVQDVCIKLNRSTQRSRGFGFVLFRDAQSAEASLGSHPELGPQVSSGFTGPPTYQSRI
ncbi:RNA recognition motif protein [Gregarina niphandrodes]|uniref:RNA recognition motif protein n=1 Tax=Gregarina niphandrodes TaxID=110365 RepID=A0A023B393_GRENI|nr:RNA recognition motif protein [Gregarina niphandrodes]EZG55362.1 RNA recognition motif protein [Gregarina niphandrodes]|eukprot:XP_011131609.1 RNA recognition motif protein [Gregarina niphandrodes]